MKRAHLIAAAVAAFAIGEGALMYWLGMRQAAAPATALSPAQPAALPATIAEGEAATRRHMAAGLKAGEVDPANGQRILYYHDPMVPGKQFDAPGKSPFMDMMLVPMYAGAAADTGTVSISPRMQQNLGLRTAQVVQGTLAPQFSAAGSIAWNERAQVVVQARAAAFVEKLHGRAALDRVARGQPLVTLHVPDWIVLQEDYLALARTQDDGRAPLREAALARMRQAGMPEELIRAVERTGRAQPRVTLAAPMAGVLTEVAVREGMAVLPGTTLLRINGTGTVWAQAEVPESQAALVRPGTRVAATTPSLPGETFDGRVQALLPEVAGGTRTLKARMEIANTGGRLVPGMFVEMRFRELGARSVLLVPTEAVIQTGRRAVVMLAEDGGRFRPVEIEPGAEAGDRTEVRRGLQAGQKVVVSSQFLVDSEASLRGLEARLNGGDKP